ncbi:MAG: RNA polymerase sigma factor [Dermatophilaceae bacterium]
MSPLPVDPAREQEFRDLVGTTHGALHRYLVRRCPPGDVDDALAEVLLVLWRRFDDVPAEEPLPWCYGVARGVLANQRRSERRRTALVARVVALDPPRPATPPSDDDHPSSAVTEAMSCLRATDQELLRLWAWEELGPAEIATVLGTSANAAAIRLHRAKGRLRTALAMKGLRSVRTGTVHGEEAGR